MPRLRISRANPKGRSSIGRLAMKTFTDRNDSSRTIPRLAENDLDDDNKWYRGQMWSKFTILKSGKNLNQETDLTGI